MPKNLVVLIREDPTHTPRASEAMRIALGLSTGPNPIKIVLLDNARHLISDDAYDLPDGEILEKYLPAIKNLELPIVVPIGSGKTFSLDQDFTIQESTPSQIASLVSQADRVLTF
ncbi:MAG: DsrE family protein [Nitrospirota bacterium]|nr:DsrE family protein [Nitrospirota bacterium]MDH5699023.1 DsrE family protein [Nitrospirota bacterium]